MFEDPVQGRNAASSDQQLNKAERQPQHQQLASEGPSLLSLHSILAYVSFAVVDEHNLSGGALAVQLIHMSSWQHGSLIVKRVSSAERNTDVRIIVGSGNGNQNK